MKRFMLAAVSATALSLGLVAVGSAPVLAQGVQQLQESVTNSLAQLGIDTSMVDMLTLRQLAEIELVVNGTDTDEVKRGRIEEIMSESGASAGGMGTASSEGTASGMTGMDDRSMLEESVSTDLAQLGIESDVSALSEEQLAEIMLVTNGDTDQDLQRERIQEILGTQ